MEIPLRTAYGQAGRCGMQPKPSSLRAQAHPMLTASVRRKAIFGSRSAIQLQLRRKRASCSKIKLIYSVNGESVRRKAIFGSRAASKFSFGERERPAHRRSNGSTVLTARVSEGKAIFGSRTTSAHNLLLTAS
ncbi:hypothetical protein TNCV_1422201 [Trichonephila clavipes]|nr:hypothetical protein TNCV_1422201 [Trichonephila clavipes]